MNPAQEDLLRVLAHVYLEHQRPEKAIILLEALAVFHPGARHLLKPLALAYLAAGRYEDGATAAQRFLNGAADGETVAPMYIIESRALWALGRKEDARRSVRRFIEARAGT